MSVKRIVLLCVFFSLVVSGLAFAQPSIAFLDTILDTGVEQAVQGPVTEKIIQELVASGKYTVLDRAHVTQVLKEKQFQLSGLVADAEIKQAGIYLGAAFVGVARVSKVGNTYFISAKIINVETGAIVSQVSDERQGGVEVVLQIAKNVGRELVGGKIEEIPPTAAQQEPQPLPSGKDRVKTQKTSANKLRAHVVGSYVLPVFAGDLWDYTQETVSYATSEYGLDVHILQPLFSLFYVSAGLAVTSDSFIISGDSYLNFSMVDVRVLVGAAFPIGPMFQVYAGVGGAMEVFAWGVDGDGGVWENPGTESGSGLCVEVGADMFLGKVIVVDTRLQLISAALSGDYTDGTSMGYVGFTIGAGISY